MWRPEKTARPSFLELKKTMKKINVHKRNIIDTMMEAVESYAHSLEEKVAERTGELEKLTKNMEALLHSMMPSSIANKLFRGEHVEPEYYESVTLCFTDVVGFTSIAAMSLPADLVTMLNDLYTGECQEIPSSIFLCF
jgi:class 3 adenylate cyclase